MTDILLTNEPLIRLAFFLGILVLMAAWEFAAPRRRQTVSRWVRWPNNLAVAALNTALLRILFPTAAVGWALVGEERAWGLLNNLNTPRWAAVMLSLALLDLAIYFQHVLFHAVPVLWRLHRMHHADLDLDVTSGARFHPIEILLSLGIKFAVIVPLGAPPVSVLVF